MGADLSSETGVKNAARSYQVSESKQCHSEQSVKNAWHSPISISI